MDTNRQNGEHWRNSIEIITIDDDDDEDIVIVDHPVDPLNVSASQNDFDQFHRNTVPSTNGNTRDSRITKELTFNGQKKNFVLLNPRIPTTPKQSETSPNPLNGPKFTGNDYHMARVQCPRCKNNVFVESFREHIDSCHPRNSKHKKAAHNIEMINSNVSARKKKTNSDDGPPDLRDSVYSDVIHETKLMNMSYYNSSSKKIPASYKTDIFHNTATETSTHTALNNFNKPVKYTARKSTSSKNEVAMQSSANAKTGLTNTVQIQNQDKKDPNNMPERTRSKSCSFGAVLSSNKNDVAFKPANGAKNLHQNSNASKPASENSSRERYTINNTDDVSHASQLAYYKKFLEIRNKSGLAKSAQIQEKECVVISKPEVNLNESLEVSLLLEDNTFACSVCSFTTDKQRTLLDHERNHRKNNKKIYQCAYCDQKYTRHMLYSHIHNVHPGQKFGFLDDAPIVEITELDEQAALKCLKCLHVAASESDLEEHDKLHKPDKTGQISCNLCSFVTNTKSKMDGHFNTHAKYPNDPLKQCSWCDYKSIERSLRAHSSTCQHRPAKIKSLTSAGRSLRDRKSEVVNPVNLRKSEPFTKSKDNELLTKPLIQRNNKSLNSLQMEEESQPVNEPTMEKDLNKLNNLEIEYKCDLCSFSSKFNVQKVHRDSHKFNPIVKCDLCEYKSTPRVVQRHQETCNKKSEIETSTSIIRPESDLCELKSKPRVVERHQETCTKKSEIKTNNPSIIRPESSEIKQPIFNCSQCKFATSLQKKLDSHIKDIHPSSSVKESFSMPHQNNQESLQCMECPFKAYSLIELNSHNQKPHVRLFQCGNCSFFTLERVVFNKHLNSHNTKNPVITCGKCCYKSTQSYLTAHLKIHNNIGQRIEDGPFNCDLCSHGSSAKIKLELHRKSHQAHPFHKCPLCSFKSTRVCVLRHVKYSHKTNLKVITSVTKLDAPEKDFDKDIWRRSSSVGPPTLERMDISEDITEPNLKLTKPDVKLLKPDVKLLKPDVKLSKADVKLSKPVMLRKPDGKFTKPDVKLIKPDVKLRKPDGKFTKPDVKLIKPDVKLTKPDVRLKCEFCSLVFKTAAVLTQHVNNEHNSTNSSSFKCKFCSAVFLVQNALNRHIACHRNNTPMVKCQFCDYTSSTSQVQKHEGNCPEKSVLKEKRSQTPTTPEFHCTMCSYSTKLRIKLNMHLKAKHSASQSPPVREIDSSPLSSKEPPKKRRRTQDDNIVEENPSKKAKLFDNNIRNRTRSRSVSEIKKKVPEPKLPLPSDTCINKLDVRVSANGSHCCSICSYSTNTQAGLTSHVSGHKNFNGPVLQCYYCNIKGTDTFIKKHKCSTDKMKRVIEPMKVRLDCDKCSFTTYFPLDFFEHKTNCTANKSGKNIGSIKSFKCKFCSFTSFWQYLIERHLDSHTVLNLPIEQCPNCDFHSTPVALMAHKNKCIKRENKNC